MSLQPGTKLGPYEILAPLGAGGMGEVYTAKDPKLGRLVAIKVLPESLGTDPGALQRFEREARSLAALQHPNVLGIFEFGNQDGVAYAVMELLEGETLRDLLGHGPLSLSRAVDIIGQMAQGLAAAHGKGIIHRDLKPENVFILKDRRVKLLDFGLAKQLKIPDSEGSTVAAGIAATEAGMLLGTIGYMAPEQVRGEGADARSDLFNLGIILHEMLSGRRPFRGDTTVEVLNAILKEEPPELQTLTGTALPPGLERVLRHALEKDPDRRFQNAKDFAFGLEGLVTASGAVSPVQAVAAPWKGWRSAAAILAIAGVSGLSGWFLHLHQPQSSPTFRRLTFERGEVLNARFVPGSQDLLYTARWRQQQPRIFSLPSGATAAEALNLPGDVNLVSVSPSRELALQISPRLYNGSLMASLARAVVGGGTPRVVAEDVQGADWIPGGTEMAAIRFTGRDDERVLEFPLGSAVRRSPRPINALRASPRGDQMACFEEGNSVQGTGEVVLYNRQGNRQVLGEVKNFSGLAWHPDGQEVWFSEADNQGSSLWALTTKGQRRLLLRQAGLINLLDIGTGGRVMVSLRQSLGGVVGLVAGHEGEIDLTWQEAAFARQLSPDGQQVLISGKGNWGGSGSVSGIFLRPTDGGPALNLGKGENATLSPDRRWVLCVTGESPLRLLQSPTGAGSAREITVANLDTCSGLWFFPDGLHALAAGSSKAQPTRMHRVDLKDGTSSPVSPEWTGTFLGAQPISPDGATVLLSGGKRPLDPGYEFYPVAGGPSRPLPGTVAGDIPLRWTPDGRGFLVFNRDGLPARVHRVDLSTGQRTLVREIMPANPEGIAGIRSILLSDDARTAVYSFVRELSELYLIEGLK